MGTSESVSSSGGATPTAARTGSRRLPRLPHAAGPRPDEEILKRSGADLQNGWLGRHGEMYLTQDRLIFVPTLLDTLMRAKRREISLDDILEIERFPVSPGALSGGAKRPRVLIHTAPCVYELMFGDIDAWIDSLERVYLLRERRGRPHRPTITREDYTNLLMMEE